MDEKFVLAASTSAYGKYPLEKAIEGVAKAGYKYVEIACTDGIVQHIPDEEMNEEMALKISSLLHKYDIKIYAFSAHTSFIPDEFESRFSRRVYFGKKIEAQIIVTNIPHPKEYPQFIRSVRNIIPLGEELGVKICLESPGHILTPIGEFIDLIDHIGSPIVCLTYDVGNVFTASLGKKDPNEEISTAIHSGKLALLHLKDVLIEGELWRFTQVGRGQINFDQLLSKIREYIPLVPLTVEMPLFLEGKGNQSAYVSQYSPSFELVTEQLYASRLFIEKFLYSQEVFY